MKSVLKYYLFITAATLFIGCGFTSADFVTAPVAGAKDGLILLAQWTVLVVALWPVVYLLSINRWVFALVYPLLCVLSGVLAYFRYTTGTMLTTMILDVFFDNHSQGTLIHLALVAVFGLTLILSCVIVRYRWKSINVSKGLLHGVIAVVALGGVFSVPPIQRPVRNRIPFNLYFVAADYFSERHAIAIERPAFPNQTSCENGEDLLVVCVIGEALRADHLELNGYSRRTTPRLAREDVVSLSNVYSEYTYTNSSLAHILTRADSLRPDLKYTERSFVDLFKQCDYYTAWLAHQASTKAYVYFMNECDTLVHLNVGKSAYVFDKWVDGDMLPAFDALLSAGERKSLIILHTIGSHWYYHSHYTDDFERFTPVTKSRIVSSNTKEEMINSYDNTVLYTDYFLSELIDRLRNKTAVLFYLSDHGEALGEDGLWLHAADAPPIHRPACLVWMSPRYKDRHPERYERLQQNRHKHYRTDFFFPTLTEAAGIRNEAINSQLSLFR
jgi:glucan phosphoethanolaminetransferase (alkaline phosphatase superfamily)